MKHSTSFAIGGVVGVLVTVAIAHDVFRLTQRQEQEAKTSYAELQKRFDEVNANGQEILRRYRQEQTWLEVCQRYVDALDGGRR